MFPNGPVWTYQSSGTHNGIIYDDYGMLSVIAMAQTIRVLTGCVDGTSIQNVGSGGASNLGYFDCGGEPPNPCGDFSETAELVTIDGAEVCSWWDFENPPNNNDFEFILQAEQECASAGGDYVGGIGCIQSDNPFPDGNECASSGGYLGQFNGTVTCVYNYNQAPTNNDLDGDGVPNEYDSDIDGDGVPNESD
jgi:hypothetical protein